MIKEIKYGGITTTPSDYESKDGDLASSSGIVLDEGRILVTRTPTQAYPVTDGLEHQPLFIHNTTDGKEVYITYGEDSSQSEPRSSYLWYIINGTEEKIGSAPNEKPKKIDAIGNTLICLYGDGTIHYIVYKNGSYTDKGTHIPTVELQFGLWGDGNLYHEVVDTSTYTFEHTENNYYKFAVPSDQIDTLTNMLFGQAEKLLNEKYYGEGKFVYPFFVRYALKLYDGSYTNVSPPILMLTNIGKSPTFGFPPETQPRTLGGYDTVQLKHLHVVSMPSTLKVLWSTSGSAPSTILNGWDDIVLGLDVFISSPLMTYDTLGKIGNFLHAATGSGTILQGVTDAYCESYVEETLEKAYSRTSYNRFGGTEMGLITFEAPYLDMDEFEKKASEISTFYKLCSYKFSSNDSNYGYDVVMGGSSGFVNVPFDKKVLPVLETQKALPDDYYSNDSIKANALFTYNSRINLANISRSLFKGFSPSVLLPPYSYVLNSQVDTHITQATRLLWYYVVIEENGVCSVVESDYSNVNSIIFNSEERGVVPPFFFYPNPNATQLIICKQNGALGSKEYYTYDLTPHPMLNGSYAIFVEDPTVGSGGSRPSVLNTPSSPIPYPSQIYTSEAYNPYVFKAENINQLPIAANILNIASTTQPMSQGQFGQYPLYVFSDMGIFALELASNGNFSGLTPVTRDIILGDGSSLTQLDDSLLFATKQGIMELVGKNTRCISTELDVEGSALALADIGKITDPTNQNPEPPTVTDFKTFISGCKMVYDYVNARIVVFNPALDYAYIYSAKDKAWSIIDRYDLIDTINSYPEAQAVASTTTTTNNVETTTYSILDLSTITDEQTAQAGQPTPTNEGWFITRPISLDADNNFKFIDTIRQNGVFEEYMVKESGEYKGYNAVALRNNPEIGDPVYAETGAHEVVRQVLYGSNDLINWFVCGSSRSRYITELKGAQFKWYRLAVRTKFKYGESLSSVTFSYRIKTDNPHLF